MTNFLNSFEEESQTDFNNPGSHRSGEYLYSAIQSRARRFIENGKRSEVVAVTQHWIQKQTRPETLIAVKLSDQFRFKELLSDIEALNKAVIERQILLPYYSEFITPVIQSLRLIADKEG